MRVLNALLTSLSRARELKILDSVREAIRGDVGCIVQLYMADAVRQSRHGSRDLHNDICVTVFAACEN